MEITPALSMIGYVAENWLRMYVGVSAVVDAYAVAHSVVDADSGMTYPAVRVVTPVPESYDSPVAVFDSNARMYAGVSAVVEAYACAHCDVLAVKGMTYPAVNDVSPVVLLYVSPVAVFVNMPQIVEEATLPVDVMVIVSLAPGLFFVSVTPDPATNLLKR